MERTPLYLDYTNGEIKELEDDDTLGAPFLSAVFPVDSVVGSIVNEDPAGALGYGAWTLLGNVVIGATTVYYFKRVE